MPFVKLDTKILDSTLWMELECREIFITALLMAEPTEISEPMEALRAGSLEPLGFTVQPGWYGFVPAAGPAIARRAMVAGDGGLAALEKLASPDAGSRSVDHEGRRMVRVDGGYLILNYMKYRDKDHTAAERQKRLRERRKAGAITPLRHGVTPNRYVTSRIADADADADKNQNQDHGALNKARPRRATRIPDDFCVTDEHREFSRKHGLPRPDDHIEAFHDYWRAEAGSKGCKLDWDATFRNWLRREIKGPRRSPAKVPEPSPDAFSSKEAWERSDRN
jgi:hypothetical protein